MPVKTQITSQKFYSQYRNGETWSLLPDDFTSWLLGSVGEKIRFVVDVQVSWGNDVNGSPNDGFSVSGNTITRQSGSFIDDDGFSLGDGFIAWGSSGDVFNPNITTGEATITYIDHTTITCDQVLNFPSNAYTFIRLQGRNHLEGCFFKYGLIENNESNNFDSKISFTEQAYAVNGLVAAGIGVPLPMVAQNSSINKSWVNGSVTCQYDDTLANGTVKKYQIVHEFIILPYFIDGWIQNVQSGQLPNLFNNNQSLKYIFEADFRKTVNNPNEKKIVEVNNVQGNVGWDGQNLNGFQNKFNVSNVSITEQPSGNSSSGIIIDKLTRYNFTVNNSVGAFTGNEKVMVLVSALPDQSSYTNPARTVEENFLFDSKLVDVNSVASSSSIIKDVQATWVAGSVIDVQADIEYTTQQQLLINDSNYYGVWVIIGSEIASFTANSSNALDDRARLKVDANLYVKNSDVPGMIRPANARFFRHYREYGVDSGKTDFKAWIEDGYLWHIPVEMVISLAEKIETAKFSLVAYNSTTGDSFELSSYNFDLTNQISVPIPFDPLNNYLYINDDSVRGYDLENTDQFNFAKFITGSFIGDNVITHDVLIGFKHSFEEWIALPGADTIFFDNTKPNNGLNKKASNYSMANGYAIRTFLDLGVVDKANGGITQYRITSPDGLVYDFDVDGNEPPNWDCQIETTSEDGTQNFGGLIKTDENTRILATFTPQAYVPNRDYFAVLRMNDENGTEFSVRELSSMTTVPSAFNPASPVSELIPIVGETGSEIDDNGALVTVEALIDYTKVSSGKCYLISSRLWDEVNTDVIIDLTPNHVGGNNGRYNVDVLASLNGSVLPDNTIWTVILRKGSDNSIIGIAQFNNGDDMQSSVPISETNWVAGVQPYMQAGSIISSVGSFDFLKRLWANATGNYKRPFIELSEDLLFQVTTSYGGFESITLSKQKVNPNFVQNGIANFSERYIITKLSGTDIKIVDTQDQTTNTFTTSLNIRSIQADPNRTSNGLPIIYALGTDNPVTTTKIYELSFDGINSISEIEIYDFGYFTAPNSTPFVLRVDTHAARNQNGRSIIWVGSYVESSLVSNGEPYLQSIYWDGSSYQISNILNKVGSFSLFRPNVQSLDINPSNGNIYIGWWSSGSAGSRISEVVYGGGTGILPSEYTYTGARYPTPQATVNIPMRPIFIIAGTDNVEGDFSGAIPMFYLCGGDSNSSANDLSLLENVDGNWVVTVLATGLGNASVVNSDGFDFSSNKQSLITLSNTSNRLIRYDISTQNVSQILTVSALTGEHEEY